MNRVRILTRLTLMTQLAHSATAFASRPSWASSVVSQRPRHPLTSVTSRPMSSLNAGSGGDLPQIRQIGKDEMKQIIEDYENGGRQDSGYLVLDVRGEDEVMMTGKVSPGVITLPLPIIMAKNVFAMDEEDFEDLCGFEKPQLDETLVFSCAAGIRSQQAAIFAAQAGYGNLVNYMGGAKEWF